MQTLIIYASRDGQTRKIAETLGQQLSVTNRVELKDLLSLEPIEWQRYDQVVLGASIRYGHFAPQLQQFVERHQHQLAQRVSGFFSVNLTARKPGKDTPQTNAYTRKFLEGSPWQPECCAVFAGALRYPRYRWFDRFMIRLIMKFTGGETDTSQEFEYTDWQKVKAFGENFAAKPSKTGSTQPLR